MAVYKRQESKYWWYKFTWKGAPVRKSTKQTKRVAEPMEAAHKTALAKGEVGIVEKQLANATLNNIDESLIEDYVQGCGLVRHWL